MTLSHNPRIDGILHQVKERDPPAMIQCVRLLLAPEVTWTQEMHARDRMGLTCDPAAPWAQCWCLTGALFAFRASFPDSCFERVVDVLKAAAGTNQLPTFNDTHSHDELMVVLNKAYDITKAMGLKDE